LVVVRAAWAQAHLQSRELRTATPAAGVVRGDTLAIRELCRTLMPLDSAAILSGDMKLRAVINRGARAFAEIAGCNVRVLAELDATGHLYLPARRLTGTEVTEDVHLVTAKLRGDFVRAPHHQIRQLAQSYKSASALGGTELNPHNEWTPQVLSGTDLTPPAI
jgi:hypothetical protein